jgi:hypothetical protein
MGHPPSRWTLGLAWTQGIFYLATGIWPLLHMESFLWVTGPKVDLWLVQTVGILVAVVGAVLLLGAIRHRIGPELMLLAAGCAAGLAGIDIYYALADRISDIYLMDALAEIGLVALWGVAALAGRRRPVRAPVAGAPWL